MAIPKTKLPTATPEQFDGMTLMGIRLENVMRIRIVDITVNRTITTIGGKNKQGKTALLNGVKWLLGGKEVIEDQPIHDGKREGKIIGNFGDGKDVKLKITRAFRRVGDEEYETDVEIEIPGHITPSRVVEFVKKLAGDKAVDPTDFDEMTDEEKFETCRKFAGDFDFKANAAARKKIFDKRTDVKRDRDREQAAADSIVTLIEPPCERIDEDALTKELREAGEKNTQTELRRTNRENANARLIQLRADAQEKLNQIDVDVQAKIQSNNELTAELQRQIDELQQRLAAAQQSLAADVIAIRRALTGEADALTAEADALQAKIDGAEPLPPVVDVTAIEQKLSDARKSNKALVDWESQRKRRKEYQTAADALTTEAEELTGQITELDQARQDAITKAHLPVDGLGFGDGFVTLCGKPWRQGSTAERAEASAAISMAMKPHIKVLIFRNASNMDSETRERIRVRAEAEGYHVLMEVVDETGANSHVFLEDGAVRLIDGKEPPPLQEPEPLKLTAPASATEPEQPASSPKKQPRRWQGPGAPTDPQA